MPVAIRFQACSLPTQLRAFGLADRAMVPSDFRTSPTAFVGNLGFEAGPARDACYTLDRIGPDGERHPAEDAHAMSVAKLHEEFTLVAVAFDVLAAIGAVQAA